MSSPRVPALPVTNTEKKAKKTMAKWFDKAWAFFQEDPIYAKPSHDVYAEGWTYAIRQEQARANLAERRLGMIRAYAETLGKLEGMGRFGTDLRTLLDMTEEELNEDYGDN